jgi:GTP-binding protein HflX
VASFKATLEEALSADLLLHVVDVSSPQVFEQIQSVELVLKEIDCGEKEILTLLNKSDTLCDRRLFDTLQTVYPNAIAISAKTGMNLDQLAAAVAKKVRGKHAHFRVRINAADGKLLSFLHANARNMVEKYDGDIVEIEATLGQNQIIQLRKLGVTEYELI